MFSIEKMKVEASNSNIKAEPIFRLNFDTLDIFRQMAEGEKLKSINVDQEGRLHNEYGPAYEFFEGDKGYYLEGLKIPEKFYKDQEGLTKEDFKEINNVEVRRTIIQYFGPELYIKLMDFKVINTGELNGTVYELLRSKEPDSVIQEHICNIKVTCPSTDRVYYLGVPNTFTDALEALAWTFDMEVEEYQPAVET